jgi:DNA gyrase/topoisomerase IV subunit A
MPKMEGDLISPEKIEEWLQEIQKRPNSAPVILQFIANRLRDLTSRNEELAAENIELRLGKKVEEYENRIANLEYQIELLKRQLGGEPALTLAEQGEMEAASLILYNSQGQTLRVPIDSGELVSGRAPAAFEGGTSIDPTTRLLVASPKEELLFVFDSGRTAALPVSALPSIEGESLDWGSGYLEEPRGDEELVAIVPVARMSLYEFCLQLSRRGCVKKIRESFFESYLGSSYIGSGIKARPDKSFDLVFAGNEDRLILASREGFLAGLPVDRMPQTIEEVFRLGPVDYLVAGFIPGKKTSLLVLTQTGKVIHREPGWLETPETLKTRGQAVFSKERREAGVRVVAAAAVDEEDWGAALDSRGRITLVQVRELLAAGSLSLEEHELVCFYSFSYSAGSGTG